MSGNPEFRIDGISISPLVVVISAPSGGGKTTLCENVLKADSQLERAITCTTRPPRPGETDGVDYYFLDPAEFQRRVGAGEFLEQATVHGHHYGTLKREVLDRLNRSKGVLLNIDVQGAAQVRKQAERDAVLEKALVRVFLMPPSVQELENRLRGRGTDTEEVIQKRLAIARQEMDRWPDFDYVLVSGSRAEDLGRMLTVLQAERLRAKRVQFQVES